MSEDAYRGRSARGARSPLARIVRFIARPFLLPIDLCRLSVDAMCNTREAFNRFRTLRYRPCRFCSTSAGEDPRPVPRALNYANLWVFRMVAPCVRYPTSDCDTPHCCEPNMHKRSLRHFPLGLLVMAAGWGLLISGGVWTLRGIPRDLGTGRIAQVIRGGGAAPFKRSTEIDDRKRRSADRYLETARGWMKKGELEKARVAYLNAARQDPERGDIRLEFGRLYLQKGEAQHALREFRRAVIHDPELAEAHMEMAWIYLLAGQDGVAAKHLDEAEKNPPGQTSHLHLLRAQVLLQDGQAENARKRIKLAMQQENVEAGHLNRAGRLLLALKDVAAAEARFRTALRMDPANVQAQVGLASSHVMQGEMDEALKRLNAAAKKSPGNTELLLLRAELDALTGRSAEALAGYRNLLDRSPEVFGAKVRLAELLLVQGKADEARVLAEELSEDSRPRASKQGHLLLARIHLVKQFYSETLRHGRQVLKQDPDQQAARLLVARALYAQKKYPDAILELKQVLLRAPDRLDALTLLASAQLDAGDEQAAIATLRDAMARHPGERGPTLNLAHYFFRTRRFKEALPLYRKDLEGHADDAAAANNVAMTLVELKRDLDEAHRLAGHALERFPDNPLFADAYGWVLVAQGKTEEGLPYLQTAARALPRSPRTTFHLGAAYHRLGDREKARRLFTDSLALSSSFEHADEAKRLLADMQKPE